MARIKVPECWVIDFETDAIRPRPAYPPEPVGVSIIAPRSRKCEYLAWGHPSENNCTRQDAVARLQRIVERGEPLLFHNGKFDIDVMETHMEVPEVSWERIHDTMFLLFLDDPHARSLSLKPAAARLLDMPPEEQDAVKDWVLAHKKEIEAHTGERVKPSQWGAWIGKAPGKLVGRYAKGDVLRTLKLFRLLYPRIVEMEMLEAYDRKRELMRILLANEREGLRVDRAALERDLEAYGKCAARADSWLRKRFRQDSINLDSDSEVASALRDTGVVTEFKLTPTGKDSVSKKNLAPDMFTDPTVYAVLGYRNRLATCTRMFMEPWLAQSARNGRIQPSWNQVRQPGEHGSSIGTRTGRLSCRDPNLLNLSKDWYDKGDGYEHPKRLRSLKPLPLVRRYILPDEGHVFCHRDYSQQELRMLAHFEEDKLAAAYAGDPNLDVHSFVRDAIREITGQTFERRAVKILNFGMLYGMGVGRLAESIGCTTNEARALKAAQLSAIPGLKALTREIKQLADSGGYIRTWGGRVYYPEPPKEVNGRWREFSYKLLNYLIQGSSADFTEQAMINYARNKENGRFLVTVYDEINISAPRQHVKSEMAILKAAMETDPTLPLDVPMRSDADTGPNWADLTPYKD